MSSTMQLRPVDGVDHDGIVLTSRVSASVVSTLAYFFALLLAIGAVVTAVAIFAVGKGSASFTESEQPLRAIDERLRAVG